MRTLTITFHASHNHGSMLQAFAFQQIVTEIYGENEILNFRTVRQERMMRVFSMRPAIGPILKDISHLFFFRSLKKRHQVFENFIDRYLCVTNKTYRTLDELKSAGLKYDLFIAGSDQIWNPRPADFDWAYYLPFGDGCKISYAASMGPYGELSTQEEEMIRNYLKNFSSISVREQGTKAAIERISEDFSVEVNTDPVFLLDAEQWCSKLPINCNHENFKYIFFYTLFADKAMIDMVKKISKETRLPVITPYFSNIHDVFSPFEKQLASGPIEFLQLLLNAELVVTSSFHGTAFSILFHKRLISLRGMADNRIGNLLRLVGMEDCAIASMDEVNRVLNKSETEWSQIDTIIEQERQRSITYLKKCME